MKEVRILTINDGKEEVLANGDYFYAETYPRTEEASPSCLKERYKKKRSARIFFSYTCRISSVQRLWSLHACPCLLYERKLPMPDTEQHWQLLPALHSAYPLHKYQPA